MPPSPSSPQFLPCIHRERGMQILEREVEENTGRRPESFAQLRVEISENGLGIRGKLGFF